MAEFNLENYEKVKQRKKRFYQDNPDGRLIVQCLEANAETAFFKVFVYKNGDELSKNLAWATGFAREFKGVGGFANKASHTENCEESAVGRALDNAGYASSASAEEMAKTDMSQFQPIKSSQPTAASNTQQQTAQAPGHQANPEKTVTTPQLKRLFAISKNAGWNPEQVDDFVKASCQKQKKDLNQTEYNWVVDRLQNATYAEAMEALKGAQQPSFADEKDVPL